MKEGYTIQTNNRGERFAEIHEHVGSKKVVHMGGALIRIGNKVFSSSRSDEVVIPKEDNDDLVMAYEYSAVIVKLKWFQTIGLMLGFWKP